MASATADRELSPIIINANRECVLKAYDAAKADNHRRFIRGDVKATSEYIYQNQIIDANAIVDEFYKNNRRIISIQKKTKVGADGLMIEIAKLMTTHIDDNFITNIDNLRFLTGMSNISWERDMIEKAPSCFKDKIFHHGKLGKSELENMKNSLIFIDEIDTGTKELQKLHTTLKEANILDVEHMLSNNNRFVIISATMILELRELYRWGDKHCLYKMTIPTSYIGHKEFLDKGIILPYYPVDSKDSAEKWIQEDIIDNYGTDYRVHIIRTCEKNIGFIQDACIRKREFIVFKNHMTDDKLTDEELKTIFGKERTKHVVLAIKGYYRRANLIPNIWKLVIGAMMELYTDKVDNNVQIQGLPGRMSGYWKEHIERGHKTGPYRTSIEAIEQYEKIYDDPFALSDYQTASMKIKGAKVSGKPKSMLAPHNIRGLQPIPYPSTGIPHRSPQSKPIIIISLRPSDNQFIKDNIRNAADIFKYLLSKFPEQLETYRTYKPRCWHMDTPDKEEKWGLEHMRQPNAYSASTNIYADEKTSNILMMYLWNGHLILSPWNGEQQNHEE